MVTLEGGEIRSMEMRSNPGRDRLDMEAHELRRGSPGAMPDCHGAGAAGAAAHQAVATAIRDCEAVLAGGMSWASRGRLAANGIRPILTEIEDLQRRQEPTRAAPSRTAPSGCTNARPIAPIGT